MNNNNNIILLTAVTAVLILSMLAMTLLPAKQITAQCATTLTLGAYPNKGMVGLDSNTLGVSLFGDLKCGDEGIKGATITITGLDGDDKTITTDNFGSYGTQVRLSPGVYTIEATYDGDDQNSPASAMKTITANENPQNK